MTIQKRMIPELLSGGIVVVGLGTDRRIDSEIA